MNAVFRWASRRGQVGVVLLWAFAGLTGELRAQGRPDADGGWRPGISLGAGAQVTRAVQEFSSQICPGSEVVLEGRAGWWLDPRKGFLLSVAHHTETAGGDFCDRRRLLAPPDSGLITYLDGGPLEGYPYGSATLRMILGAGSRSGLGTHGFLGVQWLWSKGIVSPLVGMGVSFAGGGGVTMFVEGQGSLLTLPFDIVTVELRGGQPVTVLRREGWATRAHMAVRAGIDVAVGFF